VAVARNVRPSERGIIVRSFPDWYAEIACGGAATAGAALSEKAQVSLQNNDPQQRDFIIYSLSLGSTMTNPVVSFALSTLPIGGVVTPCQAAQSTGPTPSGQVAQLDSAGASTLPAFYAVVVPAGGWEWNRSNPICILGPGYNLVLSTPVVNPCNLTAAFLFIPID